MNEPIRIGMVGAGKVGGGVYEIIHGRLGRQPKPNASSAIPTNSSLRTCIISKICVRDINKARSFNIDERTSVTTDVYDIIYDDRIDIVLELMGGTDLAKTVVIESLKEGKSVVSTNKILIAECLDEIKAAALEGDGAQKPYFAYEGAVCGGMPIIQTMQSSFSGDIIHAIMGITCGTSNYMLEKMEQDESEYDDVLLEALNQGFLYPSSDADGHDIAILAKLVRYKPERVLGY